MCKKSEYEVIYTMGGKEARCVIEIPGDIW